MKHIYKMIFPGVAYLVVGISLGYVSAQTTGNCDLQKSTLRCRDIIPRTVPYGVKAVSIDEYSETFIDDQAFVDVSWKDVKRLDIWGKDLVEFHYLNNSVFYPLQQLNKLRLSLYTLSGVSNLTFNGLSRLEVLEFHDCAFLEFGILARALKETNVLVHLHTLVLRDGKSTFAQQKYFEQDFVDCLITRNISTLVLSGFNMFLRNIYDISRPLPVVKLDVSNSIGVNLRKLTEHDLLHFISNLKILNNTGVGYFKKGRKPSEPETCLNSLNLSYYTRLRKLYSDNFRRPLGNFILNVDTTSCANELSYMSARFSGLSSLDLTVTWPMDSPKIEIDLSSNIISTVRITGYMPIYRLNISSNELHNMESRADFVEIFRAFTLLEYIDISKNNLNFLPHDIFSMNMLLKEIRLSRNFLKSVTFDISMYHQIAVLDLSNNSIVSLNVADRQKVSTLETAALTHRSIGYFVLDLRRNPLKCSCETITFIEWIISKQNVDNVTKAQSDVYDLTCNLEGKTIEIDNSALNSSKFLCIRTITYVTVSISLLIIVFVIWVILVKIRRRNMAKSIENLITEFKLLDEGERFLVMLSHSKDDGAIVFRRILEKFENALKQIVKVEKEVICIGDTHFRPGVAIVDEIYRCINISYIVVFVISRSFCKSAWCKLELKEAFSQSKPIILIFLEEVPIDDMSPLMKEIFDRFTRVRITRENGHLIIRPSWNVIAKSVLALSAQELKGKNVCPNILNLI